MERLEVHRRLLETLFALRAAGRISQVRLVARLYEDNLLGGASTNEAFVFLPDLHLMSAESQKRFQYGINQLAPGRTVPRSAIFNAVTERLVRLREDLADSVNLVTLALGDIVDLWREDTSKQEDIGAVVQRALRDFPEVDERVVTFGPASLRARLLIGNHELFGQKGGWNSAAFTRAKRSHLLAVGSKRPLLVTHGDLFDDLEVTLPDKVQAYFVREWGRKVKGATCKPDRRDQAKDATANSLPQGGPPTVLKDLDGVDMLADWTNVWVTNQRAKPAELKPSHKYLNKTLAAAGQLRAGQPKALGEFGLDGQGPLTDLRAVVIGHSHHPRLCVHRDLANPENNLVLVDCGAWIGSSRFRTDRPEAPKETVDVPSCHLGFLCGGDVRIYQLDP